MKSIKGLLTLGEKNKKKKREKAVKLRFYHPSEEAVYALAKVLSPSKKRAPLEKAIQLETLFRRAAESANEPTSGRYALEMCPTVVQQMANLRQINVGVRKVVWSRECTAWYT